MKHTPLIEQHRLHGAKLVDFAGWEMPIQYASVIDEYQTVRSAAGLFDVSHMGRIAVSGQASLAFLQRMTTNNVSALARGQAQYSMVCNETGGIKDDIFVYRTGDTEYLLCVNASNREKILAWLLKHRTPDDGCQIEDRTAALAQIAIQGPASRDILVSAGALAIGELKMHHCRDMRVAGIDCFIARTGYSGELGYELNVPAASAVHLWKSLLKEGAGRGLKPAGLGARDLLRLEMAYLLYGNDISEDTTPLEANAAWTVHFEKGDFVGRPVLERQRRQGPSRRLVAFELLQKSVRRHGFPILDPVSSRAIGTVTSGNLSPLLQKGIGLGYVPAAFAEPGTSLSVDIRGKILPALTVKPPFYHKPKPAHAGPAS
ncbi:MAG TPA: glycine cleavage system aminomethyltransferase GcvT [Nitrospira sp.]|nr:glycine cleavage system aminomethyltransferase GcvT [Nitrospira sp.]